MPNDVPDWSGVNLSPATDLADFTVLAGATDTVYSGAVPPGTHAIKVYVQTTSGPFKAASVTVTDTTLGATLESWTSPTASSLITPIDDLSVPTISVSVTALAGLATKGSVIAFLSDQAVAVANDPSTPIPFVPAPPPLAAVLPISGGIAANASGTIIPGVSGKIITVYGGFLGFSPSGTQGATAGVLKWGSGTQLARLRADVGQATAVGTFYLPPTIYPLAAVSPWVSAAGDSLVVSNDAASVSTVQLSGYVSYTQQ